jgi:methylated-DNA-protein-cysteine methyltransferase-like protein
MEEPVLSPAVRAAFFARVWEVVRRVPPGRVTTYGRVGEFVSPPEGVPAEAYAAYRARWVGAAMAASPPDVPWQRVVNAQGKISVGRADLQGRQRSLLEAEGVEFDGRGRIDLEMFGWDAT